MGRDASTRVTPTTTDNIVDFGVSAYYTQGGFLGTLTSTPNFMNNQKVEKITDNSTTHPLAYQSGWKYTPIKYWPNNENDKVAFFAYSPYAESNKMTTFNAAQPYPSFAISDGTDFLWATPIESGKQNVNDNVCFNFQHIMSRVAFSVEAMVDKVNTDNNGDLENDDTQDENIDSGTEIVVTEVKLSGNLVTSGSVTWKKTNDVWESSQTDDNAVAKTHTLVESNFIGSEMSTNGNVKGQKVTKDEVALSNANSYLMLVPQTVNVTIEVKYSVITTDTALAEGYSKVNNTTSTTFNMTFNKGQAYNFCLHIGMSSVKLSATVTEWSTNQDVVVNVPINEKTQTGGTN